MEQICYSFAYILLQDTLRKRLTLIDDIKQLEDNMKTLFVGSYFPYQNWRWQQYTRPVTVRLFIYKCVKDVREQNRIVMFVL